MGILAESTLLAQVRITRNPINEALGLDGIAAAERMEVYNLMGVCVLAQRLSGNNRIEVSARGWPIGKYAVRLIAKDGIKVLQFVKAMDF